MIHHFSLLNPHLSAPAKLRFIYNMSEPLLAQFVDDTYVVNRYDGKCPSTTAIEKSPQHWKIVAHPTKKDKFWFAADTGDFSFYRHEHPYLCTVMKGISELPAQRLE